MPIYFGCPNITDFFPVESYIDIDINDYKAAIATIESNIATDEFDKNYDALVEARNKFLNDYYLFPALIKFIETYSGEFAGKTKRKVLIRPELHPGFHFEKNVRMVYGALRKKIKNL
jgi:hypothetical protein